MKGNRRQTGKAQRGRPQSSNGVNSNNNNNVQRPAAPTTRPFPRPGTFMNAATISVLQQRLAEAALQRARRITRQSQAGQSSIPALANRPSVPAGGTLSNTVMLQRTRAATRAAERLRSAAAPRVATQMRPMARTRYIAPVHAGVPTRGWTRGHANPRGLAATRGPMATRGAPARFRGRGQGLVRGTTATRGGATTHNSASVTITTTSDMPGIPNIISDGQLKSTNTTFQVKNISIDAIDFLHGAVRSIAEDIAVAAYQHSRLGGYLNVYTEHVNNAVDTEPELKQMMSNMAYAEVLHLVQAVESGGQLPKPQEYFEEVEEGERSFYEPKAEELEDSSDEDDDDDDDDDGGAENDDDDEATEESSESEVSEQSEQSENDDDEEDEEEEEEENDDKNKGGGGGGGGNGNPKVVVLKNNA